MASPVPALPVQVGTSLTLAILYSEALKLLHGHIGGSSGVGEAKEVEQLLRAGLEGPRLSAAILN